MCAFRPSRPALLAGGFVALGQSQRQDEKDGCLATRWGCGRANCPHHPGLAAERSTALKR